MTRPLTIRPWMNRRARLLHGLMLYIDRRAKHGKMQPLYKSAAARFNRSILALKRGKSIGPDSIRAYYRRWQAAGRKADVFNARWMTPSIKLISPEQAAVYARRAAVDGISIAELYRRLARESGPLYFSLYTLRRTLPVTELRGASKARKALARAESELATAIGVLAS